MSVIKNGLLLLLLLLLIGTAPLNAASCIPFTVSHKRIIVQVMVNGNGPYPFLVDTGATVTIIDKSIDKGLRSNGRAHVTGIGGQRTVDERVAQIGFGTFVDAALPVVVYDLGKTDSGVDVRILGILGNDVLIDAGGLSIDYHTGCINLG